MFKAKLESNRRSDQGVADLANDVDVAMTAAAATFTASAANLTALATERATLDAAIEAARQGKIAQQALIDAKDAARVAVEKRLRKLADQVNAVADGVVETIHLAGMPSTNEPTPVTLEQVTDLQLTPSAQEGELFAQWKAQPNAAFFKVQISTDAEAPEVWVDKLETTSSKCSLNHDLVSATKVWVRVRACAANNVMGPWSDVARKTVP